MNIVLWVVFYIITTLCLLYFFFREKKVMSFLRKKEDDVLKNINLEENNNLFLGNILTVISLVVTAVFFSIIDKTPDNIIKIKVFGIYGVFILNLIFYVLREQHEWIFLGNLVMLFLGKAMFNILDVKYYIYVAINVVLSLLLVYFLRKPAKEEITEQSILKEMTQNNKDLEKIFTEAKIKNESTQEIIKKIFKDENLTAEEVVSREKRKRSSLGRAFTRITNSILAIILVLLIQMFYLGNYVIPTGSMEPTIAVKDRVFANMIKYRFEAPKVGQIIAFKEPVTNKMMYTKRIVGAPGNTLQISKGKVDLKTFMMANVDNQPVYPDASQFSDKKSFEEAVKKYYADTKAFNSLKVANVGGEMLINGKKSQVLAEVKPEKNYLPEGLMGNNKIYIPKKGDKVKLDKIIAISKSEYMTIYNERSFDIDWEKFSFGENYKTMSGKEFLKEIKTTENFKDIIGNDDSNSTENYYTFLLKVEGRPEMVMPIMDFKYDDALFTRLLNGETITLDKDYYMAMGDNTANSLDTRYFGLVAKNRIKGELLLRWWPLNRIGLM